MRKSSLAAAFLAIAVAGPAWAQTAAPTTAVPDVEPAAVQALKTMSAYLGSLTSFEVKADTSLDLVLDDGQKVQLNGVTTYLVRAPNAFTIENSTNRKARKYIYDGKQFTVYAPKLGYYAQVAAPPTIRQTLDAAEQRYGIELPLRDLFHWSQPDAGGEEAFQSASVIGDAVIDGADTTQYGFRQGDRDWQIWIQKGAQPVPRKLVIIDRGEDERPAYSAGLTWNLKPVIAPDAFAFHPGGGDKPIRIASQSDE